ncbi:hypothetical protein FOL47_003470 [Perkinsus chesapeaki]|uniref:Uncharacterized protein n=1 Tax=Perkinsus chesapeaki TaxID=330153 RepID=A0A7J6M834_PERCH|nr:hypothetical protein FOL47_003470 [Perkinsus chesapeaki]
MSQREPDATWDQNSETSNTSSLPSAPAHRSLAGDLSTKAESASIVSEQDATEEVDRRIADLDNCRGWRIGDPRPMCEAAIRKVCNVRGQYDTPHLNDCLYLQMCGFTAIGGLEAVVRNLEELTNLRTLILANNHISDFTSGLAEGLSKAPWLLSLDISYNLLEVSTGASENGCELITFLQRCCPKLNDFYAYGNSYVRQMRHYRRRVIAALPTLTYVDKSRVTKEERAGAEAYVRAGTDAENDARRAYLEAKQRAMTQLVTGLREVQRKRREELNLPEPAPCSTFDTEDNIEDCTDSCGWLGTEGDSIFQRCTNELHFDPPSRVDSQMTDGITLDKDRASHEMVTDDVAGSNETTSYDEAEPENETSRKHIEMTGSLKEEMREFLRNLQGKSNTA